MVLCHSLPVRKPLDHSWSVAAGMSGLFLLSHHLSLHHSVWRICTFFSCFIPEEPLHTTKLFTEKNLPYLPAQVAWSLLSCCAVDVGTRCSDLMAVPRGSLAALSAGLTWKRSTGFLHYSEQTFRKLVLSSHHLNIWNSWITFRCPRHRQNNAGESR